MPKYLLTGFDLHGRKHTEAVTAATADDATHTFQARGFTDVTLHSDKALGHLFKPDVLKHLTPRDYLVLGRLTRGQYLLHMMGRAYAHHWWLFLAMVALILGRRAMEEPWDTLDSLASLLLLTPPVLVLLREFFSPSRKFERAMAFNAWARWSDMHAALPAVRPFVPAPLFAFFEAKALAGLGRLEEAMDAVRPYADDPKTPAWLYWGQLADVFHIAKLGNRAIECGEKAVASAPDNPTVLIDLAMARLRYHRDTVRARPLLDRAKAHEISDVLRPFILMTDGVIALEENQPEKARELLDEAARLAEPLRHSTALMGVAIDRIHTYLTLACAAAGDLPAAERHFQIAEPRLQAFETDDLIERCQVALGHRA